MIPMEVTFLQASGKARYARHGASKCEEGEPGFYARRQAGGEVDREASAKNRRIQVRAARTIPYGEIVGAHARGT
jgi:hypothetical protein